MSAIKLENLTYIYDEKTKHKQKALEDVNLEIEKGEFVGIIGNTGAGKSTLIRHFNGLLKPTLGKVYIDDVDIWKKKKTDICYKVGIVFQYPETQLFEQTIYEDIAFGPKNIGLSDIEEKVKQAINFVGISEDLLYKNPFELSGGEQRRVAIAGVIAMEPEILVLDEPTAGLDPFAKKEILNKIKEYHQNRKNTVVIVSHDIDTIFQFASKVLILDNGKVVRYDDTNNILSDEDKINKLGSNIPEMTKIFCELKRRGIDVDTNIYTIEQAKTAILRSCRQGCWHYNCNV